MPRLGDKWRQHGSGRAREAEQDEQPDQWQQPYSPHLNRWRMASSPGTDIRVASSLYACVYQKRGDKRQAVIRHGSCFPGARSGSPSRNPLPATLALASGAANGAHAGQLTLIVHRAQLPRPCLCRRSSPWGW